MKKIVFSALIMLFGLGVYAQQTPAATASQKPAVAKKIADTPQQEAQKLVDMLTQNGTYTDLQKKSIYDVALDAVKKRKAIAALKTTDAAAYAQKEMDIFINMSSKIKEIENQ